MTSNTGVFGCGCTGRLRRAAQPQPVLLVIYFCAVGCLGFQTGKVEAAVAKPATTTPIRSTKARLGVLQERAQLKYAALDCWQLVAERIADGRRCSGSALRTAETVLAALHAGRSGQKTDRFLRRPEQEEEKTSALQSADARPAVLPAIGRHSDLEFQPGTAALGGGDEMKKYLAQLRPLERRLVVGVAVVLLIVLNWVLSGRIFRTGAIADRLDEARRKLKHTRRRRRRFPRCIRN